MNGDELAVGDICWRQHRVWVEVTNIDEIGVSYLVHFGDDESPKMRVASHEQFHREHPHLEEPEHVPYRGRWAR